MKLRITMKSPDVVDNAIEQYFPTRPIEGCNEDTENQKTKLEILIRKFFNYGELLTVEIDTEAESCVVIPV